MSFDNHFLGGSDNGKNLKIKNNIEEAFNFKKTKRIEIGIMYQ